MKKSGDCHKWLMKGGYNGGSKHNTISKPHSISMTNKTKSALDYLKSIFGEQDIHVHEGKAYVSYVGFMHLVKPSNPDFQHTTAENVADTLQTFFSERLQCKASLVNDVTSTMQQDLPNDITRDNPALVFNMPTLESGDGILFLGILEKDGYQTICKDVTHESDERYLSPEETAVIVASLRDEAPLSKLQKMSGVEWQINKSPDNGATISYSTKHIIRDASNALYHLQQAAANGGGTEAMQHPHHNLSSRQKRLEELREDKGQHNQAAHRQIIIAEKELQRWGKFNATHSCADYFTEIITKADAVRTNPLQPGPGSRFL